jgi:hypothetical protein
MDAAARSLFSATATNLRPRGNTGLGLGREAQEEQMEEGGREMDRMDDEDPLGGGNK